MDLITCEKLFFALSNETRIRIVRFLATTQNQKVQTNIVATYVNVNPHVASKHLHILREVGILYYEKQAQFALWWLNVDTLMQTVSALYSLIKVPTDESWRNTNRDQGDSSMG